MLTKPRTVWAYQFVAVMISANVCALGALQHRDDVGFLIRAVAGVLACLLLRSGPLPCLPVRTS